MKNWKDLWKHNHECGKSAQAPHRYRGFLAWFLMLEWQHIQHFWGRSCLSSTHLINPHPGKTRKGKKKHLTFFFTIFHLIITVLMVPVIISHFFCYLTWNLHSLWSWLVVRRTHRKGDGEGCPWGLQCPTCVLAHSALRWAFPPFHLSQPSSWSDQTTICLTWEWKVGGWGEQGDRYTCTVPCLVLIPTLWVPLGVDTDYWNNILTPGLYSWLLVADWEVLPPSEIRQGIEGICS